MRVIAGTLGGRRLQAPPGRDTRPTSDRVREALFSSLGPALVGARVLDLYAGSGALGIEALSRGGDHAVLVESNGPAVDVIQRNLRTLDLGDRATVHRREVAAFCAEPSGGPFDVVFCDPPYDVPLLALYEQLGALRDGRGLAAGARIVVERDRRDPHLDDEPPRWLALRRTRSYGDTVLVYLEVAFP